MIWIDSSFAVAWLLGESKASEINFSRQPLGILPSQYAETLCFFGRQKSDLTVVINEMEITHLVSPLKNDLLLASELYLKARYTHKSKASLADAILAAVAIHHEEMILSFDQDFKFLGFENRQGIWQLSQ